MLVVACPRPVEVGLDEGRGPVLCDAVLHDLDLWSREPPVGYAVRFSTSSATCSSPRSRSHHSAPTT